VGGGEGSGEDALPGAAVHAHVEIVAGNTRLRIRRPPRDGERAADDIRRRAHPHLRRRRVTLHREDAHARVRRPVGGGEENRCEGVSDRLLGIQPRVVLQFPITRPRLQVLVESSPALQ